MIWPATPDNIAKAAKRLREGELVGVPTETVYGLAARSADAEAVAKIYETKGRPRFNPLIVHVATMEQAMRLVDLDPCGNRLFSMFWPGPLTVVLPLKQDAPIADLVTAGLPTLAVRMPAHPVARQLLEALGEPFVAPSANPSGRLSPTLAAHVEEAFGGTIPVLDGGPCEAGLESTIISLTHSRPTLLRPGVITAQEIEAVLGHPLLPPGDQIEAPGMMASHYAPNAAVRLNAHDRREDEVLLGFGGTPNADLDLSPAGELKEAAVNLFAYLRQLDSLGKQIAIAPIPEEGLGEAINDRLRRAAAPRPSHE